MIKQIMAVCFSMAPLIAFCQPEKIDTDRPDQTESAFIVPKGWFQFEMGFNSQKNNAVEKEYFLPTLLSKYGLSKKFEFRLITTVLRNKNNAGTETGIEPVQLGGKLSICEEKKWLPKTSLIFHFALPKLAAKNFRVKKVAPNFRFTLQNSLTETIGLGYNLGAEWDGFSSNPTWIYTFAPGFNISPKWYGYVEAFGFIAKGENAQHSVDGGIAWYATNNLKFDLSGGVGISAAAPDSYGSLGVSWRFKARN